MGIVVSALLSSLCVDGLPVPFLAAVPPVWLLCCLQLALRGAQRLVLLGSQHAVRLLVNLR